MSVWNPDNIRDIAESVGIANLHNEVTDNLARDVEYRIAQILEEALKFMRHSKRTTMTTQDVAHALRVLDVEPLYGYESTRALRFGEASLGPGQPLFYVEDEEVDFEKLINAPLPKVPREVSFSGSFYPLDPGYDGSGSGGDGAMLMNVMMVYSTLVGRRRCPTIHPAESYRSRLEKPRTRLQGSQRQLHPGRHERQRERGRETAGQACAVQGAAAVF